MMTKELFTKMILEIQNFGNIVDRMCDVLGTNFFESPLAEVGWDLISTIINNHFDEEGQDWINWYIYERKSIITGEVLPCFDEEGKEFYVNTPEDLWKLVEQHQK